MNKVNLQWNLDNMFFWHFIYLFIYLFIHSFIYLFLNHSYPIRPKNYFINIISRENAWIVFFFLQADSHQGKKQNWVPHIVLVWLSLLRDDACYFWCNLPLRHQSKLLMTGSDLKLYSFSYLLYSNKNSLNFIISMRIKRQFFEFGESS